MIKLINGDCLEEMDKLIEQGVKVDISFTSPPYNRIRNDTYKHYDDNKKNYYEFLVNFTDKLLKLTNGYVIVNIQQNHFNKIEVYKYLGNYCDKIIGNVIWCKNNPQPSTNYDKINNDYSIVNAYEYFIVLGSSNKFRSYMKNTKNYIFSNVNDFHIDGHGAVMKYEIAEWFINHFSLKGDTILDCFMGSCTTGIACLNTNRNFIGIEISKDYFKLSEKRVKNNTQQLDILI